MMTRGRVGTEIGLVTGRIKRKFRNRKDDLSNFQSAVSERTRRAVRKTDYYVHDNAWAMIGVAAGLAFAAGFLLSRKSEGVILEAGTTAENPRSRERAKKVNSWEFVHSAIPLALFVWRAFQTAPPPSAAEE
jgi:hypothetical protein